MEYIRTKYSKFAQYGNIFDVTVVCYSANGSYHCILYTKLYI